MQHVQPNLPVHICLCFTSEVSPPPQEVFLRSPFWTRRLHSQPPQCLCNSVYWACGGVIRVDFPPPLDQLLTRGPCRPSTYHTYSTYVASHLLNGCRHFAESKTQETQMVIGKGMFMKDLTSSKTSVSLQRLFPCLLFAFPFLVFSFLL